MIKIIQINEVKAVYNGVSKTNGKPYSIWQWVCSIENNGVLEHGITVKTMSAKIAPEIKSGGIFEAKENIFQGVKSYMIESPKSDFVLGGKSNWKAPAKIDSMKKFDKVINHFWEKANMLDKTNAVQLFDRILSCGSVMLDLEKIFQVEEKKTEPVIIPMPEPVDPYVIPIDSDIPF